MINKALNTEQFGFVADGQGINYDIRQGKKQIKLSIAVDSSLCCLYWEIINNNKTQTSFMEAKKRKKLWR